MNSELEELKQTLNLSIAKKDRSATIVYSKSGHNYISGQIDSDTGLIKITSEQGAITIATISTDYLIHKVVTLIETEGTKIDVSPLILKFLVDHSLRTNVTLSYEIYNIKGEILFSTSDVCTVFSFYKPNITVLQKVEGSVPSTSKVIIPENSDIIATLKKYATQGITRNFPMYDSASGYGTAILTKNNTLYFGGQYSAFDRRLGLHSEMAAITAAIMDNNSEITHLGIISSKHTKTPCNCCGICRQFIAEVSAKKSLNIEIYCFALETDTYTTHSITNYLPDQWNNKK